MAVPLRSGTWSPLRGETAPVQVFLGIPDRSWIDVEASVGTLFLAIVASGWVLISGGVAWVGAGGAVLHMGNPWAPLGSATCTSSKDHDSGAEALLPRRRVLPEFSTPHRAVVRDRARPKRSLYHSIRAERRDAAATRSIGSPVRGGAVEEIQEHQEPVQRVRDPQGVELPGSGMGHRHTGSDAEAVTAFQKAL